jgi:protein-disulfide isomerase
MDLSGRPSKGPSDTPVTLVVYSDFECPHCRELARALSTKIEPKYPRLRIVFKQYPLTQIHPWSMVAALAARCAYEQSPEKFWLLHDLIFENQSSFAPDNAREKLIGFAQQIGLDLVQFNTCLTSDQTWRAVQADVEEARALQIANTPTVFINGRRYLGGQPEAMQQVIDYELSQARPAARTRPSRN